ncbi:unnamed protein product [Blepharisma stoltei]|uniref:RRM domain-containing protein n=1 Tax=Blepharisma stoltei TaxID=1481888 RepID=A0AAU9INJ3_9CILI|nr:unnamed protein product [Blepharisma stoltei]
MVLITFAKQLGRAVIRRKAATPFMKPSSLGFNLYKAFSTAPVSTLRQFGTFDEGSRNQSSEDSFEPRTPQPAFNNPDTDLFMGGLDWSAGEKEIKEFFSGLGEITIRIPKNPEGRSRGFAFIRFSSAESAKKALENNGKELLGRTIKIAPAGEKPPTKNNKLFVANISNSINQDTLTQHFSQYGKVVSTKIVNDQEGNPRGFGFVEFENADDALKALKSSGVELDGRALVVNISLPKSRTADHGDNFGARRQRFDDSHEEDRRGGYGNRRGGDDFDGSRRGGYGSRRGDDYEEGGRGGYEGGRGGFEGGRGGFEGGRGGYDGGRGGFDGRRGSKREY